MDCMAMSLESRPPLPPFDQITAVAKVRAAEDAWNTRDPHRVSLAYTPDTVWRNRCDFIHGRAEVVAFLARKWEREHDYRLIKEIWAFSSHRIAVRFVYESHDGAGRWTRSHGNENWEFAPSGHMHRRHASINDVSITEAQRLFRWPEGPRPLEHPSLTELGL